MKDEPEAIRQFTARLGDGPLVVLSNDIVALSQTQPGELYVMSAAEVKRRIEEAKE